MNKEQFRLLKDRLYRAENQLGLALQSCPQLHGVTVQLANGQHVNADDVLAWLGTIRTESRKLSPDNDREIIRRQARG